MIQRTSNLLLYVKYERQREREDRYSAVKYSLHLRIRWLQLEADVTLDKIVTNSVELLCGIITFLVKRRQALFFK